MTIDIDEQRPAIPVIDLSAARRSGGDAAASKLRVARELAAACRRVGFVYIANHGVRAQALKAAFAWSKRFFDMAEDRKMLAPHPDGPAVHRGYSYPGLEKVSQLQAGATDEEIANARAVTDSKESYEIGSEQNDDQPNVWPPGDVIPGFREFMVDFYWECERASKEILRVLALGLGLDESFFDGFHSGHNNQLRLLHYPPIPAAELESKQKVRIPAHTDWGIITMLFQDDCGGLQVEHPHKPGEFVDATPMENVLVMNVGDLLQRWSNDPLTCCRISDNVSTDTLKSTLHRVDLPRLEDRFTGPQRLTRARYSIPYFVSADLNATIECLPVCVSDSNPAKYGPIVQHEYRLMRASFQY